VINKNFLTESELYAMRHGAEWEKILSAFTEAAKVTVYQKISHTCLMENKILSLALSNKKN
jgi:hypothetical protein